MGKKKKSSTAAAVAPAAETGAPAAAAASPAEGAAPLAASAAPAKAAASAPVLQPWASNYDAMRLWPIPAQRDPNLFLATSDSLVDKVNRSALPEETAAAVAAQGNAAAAPASSASASAAAFSARRFLFAIFNSKADEAGRRAIALEPIPEGTLLLRERGQPWVTHAEHADKVCHECAATLYDPAIDVPTAAPAPGQQRPPSRHLHCKECEEAFYCSAACQTAHQPQHALECAALAQAEEIGEVGQCTVDLVRAAIKYAALKTREQQAASAGVDAAAASSSSPAAAAAADPYQFQSTSADCDLLLDHVDAMSEVNVRNMRSTASLVLRALPPECSQAVTPDQLVSFFGRVNSNCHALHLEAYPTIQFGFGLFPLCAIFNHSCYPNSIFVNEGASLTFRTIRPVERHEELTVNYISLYAPRTLRRKELWQEKKFFCMCRRCMLKPKNEEEREKFKQDAFIGGVACQNHNPPPSSSGSSAASGAKKGDASFISTPSVNAAVGKCPGCYRINYMPRDPKAEAEKSRKRKEARAKRKAAAAATAAAAGDSAAPVASTSDAKEAATAAPASSSAAAPAAAVDPELSSDSEDEEDAEKAKVASGEEFPLSLRPKVTSARCDVCKHAGNVDALWAIQERALDGSEQLLLNYGTGKYSPQRIRDEFEQFLREQSPLLHPSHAVLFNLLLPLVNVAGALREWKLKMDLCRRVVDLAEHCFPKHFLPMCNYYETMAAACTTVVKLGAKDNVPKKLLQKYRDEAVATLEKLQASLRVCRGAEHPLTLAAAKKLQETKKLSLTA